MQPDKSNLKLLPKPVVNSAARTASANAIIAGALTILGFLVLWAPYYLLRTDTQLVLAPFVLICVPLIWIFAIRAIVFGRRALRWAAQAVATTRSSSPTPAPTAADPAPSLTPSLTQDGATAQPPGLGRRVASWSVVAGAAALILPVPLFIFGGLPLQLLTAG